MNIVRKALQKISGLISRDTPSVETCKEIDGFVVDYLDGNLPATQRQVFEQHLEYCEVCRLYIQEYKASLALCHEVYEDDVAPLERPEPLVQAILKAQAVESAKQSAPPKQD